MISLYGASLLVVCVVIVVAGVLLLSGWGSPE